MRTIPNLLFATTVAAIAYTVAQPVQAISFTFSSGAIAPSSTITPFTTTVNQSVTEVTGLTLNLTASDLSQIEIALFNSATNNSINLFTGSSLLNSFAVTNTEFIFFDTPTTSIPSSPTALGNNTANISNGSFSFNPEGSFSTIIPINNDYLSFSSFTPDGNLQTNWSLQIYNSGVAATLNSASLQATATPTAVPFEFDGSAGIVTVGAAFTLNRWYKSRKNSGK